MFQYFVPHSRYPPAKPSQLTSSMSRHTRGRHIGLCICMCICICICDHPVFLFFCIGPAMQVLSTSAVPCASKTANQTYWVLRNPSILGYPSILGSLIHWGPPYWGPQYILHPQCMGNPNVKWAHVWKDFLCLGSLPIHGKASQVWEVFPYTGSGSTPRSWGVYYHMFETLRKDEHAKTSNNPGLQRKSQDMKQ